MIYLLNDCLYHINDVHFCQRSSQSREDLSSKRGDIRRAIRPNLVNNPCGVILAILRHRGEQHRPSAHLPPRLRARPRHHLRARDRVQVARQVLVVLQELAQVRVEGPLVHHNGLLGQRGEAPEHRDEEVHGLLVDGRPRVRRLLDQGERHHQLRGGAQLEDRRQVVEELGVRLGVQGDEDLAGDAYEGVPERDAQEALLEKPDDGLDKPVGWLAREFLRLGGLDGLDNVLD